MKSSHILDCELLHEFYIYFNLMFCATGIIIIMEKKHSIRVKQTVNKDFSLTSNVNLFLPVFHFLFVFCAVFYNFTFNPY